ncbi:hypothetical protein QUF51_07895 [Bacillus pumilus]|nr:hypothetical protein [Bacillus pumilus]
MLDSNIRGLFKRIEYQIANLKAMFSKNEKQMLDNVNEFKRGNEEFKDNQKYVLTVHTDDKDNPHKVTKTQIGLDKVENVKQATAIDFNNHTDNHNNPHKTTKIQVGLDNVANVLQASQVDFLAHSNDTNLHVTESKQKIWDAKETVQGSQAKADSAVQRSKEFVAGFQKLKITNDTGMPLISIKDTSASILDAVINNGLGQGTFYAIAGSKDLPNHRSFRGFFHMTDGTNGKGTFGWVYATDYINNIYTNYLNNNVWSGWARLSNHNLLSETGQSQLLPNGTDILSLPSGYYYAVGTNVVNMPSKTDSSWFNIYVIDNSNNRKTLHIIRSGDNLHWFGTVHTDGLFKGWSRLITDKDSISTPDYPTPINGWKTYQSEVNNDYRVRVTKNALGIVEVTGAITGGTIGDVPAFMLPVGCEPAYPIYNNGIASSAGGFNGPQFSRQYIATDGRFCIQDTSSTKEFIVVNCMFKAKGGVV